MEAQAGRIRLQNVPGSTALPSTALGPAQPAQVHTQHHMGAQVPPQADSWASGPWGLLSRLQGRPTPQRRDAGSSSSDDEEHGAPLTPADLFAATQALQARLGPMGPGPSQPGGPSGAPVAHNGPSGLIAPPMYQGQGGTTQSTFGPQWDPNSILRAPGTTRSDPTSSALPWILNCLAW